MSMGVLIERLIPRSTNFLGVNFVIEPHMLERNKLRYLFSEMYINEESKTRLSVSDFGNSFGAGTIGDDTAE